MRRRRAPKAKGRTRLRKPPNERLTPDLPSRVRAGAGVGRGGATSDLEEPTPSPSRKREGSISERTCILSRRQDARDRLIRLALSPDGEVLPDIRARAPGRGAWIGVGRAALETAAARDRWDADLTVAGATPLPRSVARVALARRAAVLTVDAAVDPRFTGQSVLRQRVRSALCAPLLAADGTPLGAVYVDSGDPARAFREADLDFLTAFAGVALSRDRLLADPAWRAQSSSTRRRSIA